MQNILKERDNLKRIVVIGSSCSGKTTLAIDLARSLNIKHIEMDALNWLPEWEQRSTEELRHITEEEIAAKSWVLDGNYSRTRDLVWVRATLIIWLNYSFPLVFYRTLRRTFRRVFTREILFSGNRETFRNTFLSTDSMILWVLRTYHRRRRQYKKLVYEKRGEGFRIIALKSPGEAEDLLKHIAQEIE